MNIQPRPFPCRCKAYRSPRDRGGASSLPISTRPTSAQPLHLPKSGIELPDEAEELVVKGVEPLTKLDDVEGGLAAFDVAHPSLAAAEQLAEVGLAKLAGRPPLPSATPQFRRA